MPTCNTPLGYVRELKLDILTNLATESSIAAILKEFQAYVRDPDKDFVSNVIQSIGRCASNIPSIAERCMGGLMQLVASPSHVVVAEAVVVICQLLQRNPDLQGSSIKSMARLLDKVQEPSARSAIVWIIGEYRDRIPKVGPDALRKLAKVFKEEADVVKFQTLNLAVKLFLSNPKQTSLLFKYIMELCKYDINYDLRDRARMVRAVFFKKKTDANAGEPNFILVKDKLKKMLLLYKPAPHAEEHFKNNRSFTLGSMSHIMGQAAPDYEALPAFPAVATDPYLRKTKEAEYSNQNYRQQSSNNRDNNRRESRRKSGFYSDDESRSSHASDHSVQRGYRSRGSSGSRSSRSRSGSGSRSGSRSRSRSKSRGRSSSRSLSRSSRKRY
jgi:AP-3 complex subunit beta